MCLPPRLPWLSGNMPENCDYPAEIERDEDGRLSSRSRISAGVRRTAPAGTRRWPKPGAFCARSSRPRCGRAAICPSRRGPRRGGPGRSAGADRAEGGPLRRVARNRDVATSTGPRTGRCRERGAAHVESRAQYQGRNDRPRSVQAGKARDRDRRRGSVGVIRYVILRPAMESSGRRTRLGHAVI